ncbi:hypothetical protein D3C85_1723370 [compost metagenome]
MRYFYRTADVAKQCTKGQGEAGAQLWQLHRRWSEQLMMAAIEEPDPARVWQSMPGLAPGCQAAAKGGE